VLPTKDTSLKEVSDPKFRVGDVWEYHTRRGEEQSRLTVVKVEESPEVGIIVHVAVDRIRLASCHGGPDPTSIPHMPFARSALDASVTKRVATEQPLPDYVSGYEEWKVAYERKKAGVYVIPVGMAVGIAEKTYRSGIGCEEGGEKAQTFLLR
jgi:hypothetical protein